MTQIAEFIQPTRAHLSELFKQLTETIEVIIQRDLSSVVNVIIPLKLPFQTFIIHSYSKSQQADAKSDNTYELCILPADRRNSHITVSVLCTIIIFHSMRLYSPIVQFVPTHFPFKLNG
jgi:hypothetical protein